MTNVVAFPDRAAAWDSMVADGERYVPIIARLVGFFLLHDMANNPDFDPVGNMALAAAGAANLTEDEREFVYFGALAVYHPADISSDVREAARAWIAEGAPS